MSTQGELIFPNGKYVGEIKDGKREGKGTFYYNDGARFEGIWVNNKAYGKGIHYFSSGGERSGFWDGDINGGTVSIIDAFTCVEIKYKNGKDIGAYYTKKDAYGNWVVD